MQEINTTPETWDAEITELRRLEEPVHKSEGDGVRARLESGRYLLTLKKGKQLPDGLLARLSKEKFGRTEIEARMKLAEKCPTDAELTDFIGKFPTWYSITHGGLTKKPRGKKTTATKTGSVKATNPQTTVAKKASAKSTAPATTDHQDGDGRTAATRPTALHRMHAASWDLDPKDHVEGDDERIVEMEARLKGYREGLRVLRANRSLPAKVVAVAGAEATL